MVSDSPAERGHRTGVTPDHVAVVFGADTEPETVREFYVWCEEFGVGKATACLPEMDERARRTLEDRLADLEPPVRNTDETEDFEDPDRLLSYLGGRNEVTGALRRIAERVEGGEIDAADVDSDTVEDSLRVPGEPDLLIEATDDGLSDVLIWQTAYSELCYVEEFDRRSFLGCLDEYRERERRFGR